jgi:hypothetical protein
LYRVGSLYTHNQNKIKKLFSYTQVEYDCDGWADAKRFLPMLYDLCLLKLKTNETKAGWSSGANWDGKNVKPEDVVLFWKRKNDAEWEKPHQYWNAM